MAQSVAHRRRLVFVCGVIPVVVTAALEIFRPSMLARIDNSTYDILLRSIRTKPPSQNVAIVDVDDRSLAAVGQWPWRRDVVARLLARLQAAGAKTIALDIIFAEPDRSGLPSDSQGAVLKPAAHEATPPDAALADVLRDGRIILGYGLTFDRSERPPCVLHPIGVVIVQPPDDSRQSPFFQASGAVCNLPLLANAAGASGFLNAAPDADGILRRAPLLAELDGRVYPALAVAAVAATTGAHEMALRVANVNAAELTIGDRVVPVDGKSNLLLRYRGEKRTFSYVSAVDVLSEPERGDLDAAVRGKIVFVGTSALGTRDVVATPLDTLFAGVEVQATVADNLLAQDFIRRSQLGPLLDSLVVLALGAAIAFGVARIGFVPGLAGAATGIAVVWWGAGWLLSARGVFVSPLPATTGVVVGLAAMTLAKLTIERGRADSAGREKTAAQRLMVQSLLSLTEIRDAETGRHSRRTQQYARLLAEQLAEKPGFREYLTPERIDLLSSLAPLHDIGKVGVPDHILHKPGALTPEELVEMRKHPSYGRDVILNAEARVDVRDDATLQMAKDIVYTHHERWDGAGYPQGLSGAAIPVPGRVMALVDVYDAARSRTLYRACSSHDDTVAYIVSKKGTHFDPAVVDAFVTVAPLFKNASEEAAAGALNA